MGIRRCREKAFSAMSTENGTMVNSRLIWALLAGTAALCAVSCGGRKANISPPTASRDERNIRTQGSLDLPTNSPAASPEVSSVPDPDSPSPAGDAGSQKQDPTSLIVETALAQIGVSYHWGGADPEEGFDCSGLVQWSFAQNGISLPRSTGELFATGRPVRRDELEPGDLVFYAWGKEPGKATHVGIYVGDGEYVHSPGTGRSVYKGPAFDGAQLRRFLGARRVLENPRAKLETAAETPSDESLVTYRVRKGDYIWALARRYGVSPYRILKLNGLSVDSVLAIGQELLIPLVETPH